MSATEWKPGDVASWEFGNRDPLIALRVGPCRDDAHSEGPHWHLVNGGWSAVDQYARPLVVLDPESADDVVRVGNALGIVGDELLQAALRELAGPTPPKPEEPTGLGAVVEDVRGLRWVRDHEGDWSSEDGVVAWINLSAVRVLSEGVPD